MAADIEKYNEQFWKAMEHHSPGASRDQLLRAHLEMCQEHFLNGRKRKKLTLPSIEDSVDAGDETTEEEGDSSAPINWRKEYLPPPPVKYRSEPLPEWITLRVLLAGQFRCGTQDPIVTKIYRSWANWARPKMSADLQKLNGGKRTNNRRQTEYNTENLKELETLYAAWCREHQDKLFRMGFVPLPPEFCLQDFVAWTTGVTGEDLSTLSSMFCDHLDSHDSIGWEWSNDPTSREIPLTPMNLKVVDGLWDRWSETAGELIKSVSKEDYFRPYFR